MVFLDCLLACLLAGLAGLVRGEKCVFGGAPVLGTCWLVSVFLIPRMLLLRDWYADRDRGTREEWY